MITENTLRTRLLVMLGVLALVILALILPTPLHDWFVDGAIGGVPADVVILSLLILVTPVTVIALVVSKFNVDFADETS